MYFLIFLFANDLRVKIGVILLIVTREEIWERENMLGMLCSINILYRISISVVAGVSHSCFCSISLICWVNIIGLNKNKVKS